MVPLCLHKIIIFGYEQCWIFVITYTSLVITIPHGNSILSTLHAALLPNLKVMRTFTLVMRSDPACIGGINFVSLEVISGAQDINHLVSIFYSITPTPVLMHFNVESHQLEIIRKDFFLDL